jgi:glutamate carboxypeptidase
MLTKASLLLLSCCLIPSLALAEVSIEKELVNQVNNQLSESQDLLEKLVNINSGTMNFAGVRQVGAVLKNQFDSIGFTTEWVDGSEFNRAGHLVASHESTSNPQAPKVLMIGHLDTVFSEDDEFQSISEVGKNRLAGPGITDMKGGDVIIFAALQALYKLGMLEQLNIKVVMTGDEESSGRPLELSKKALIDAAIWADIALGFEDADGDINTAVTARRGSVGWTLTTTGNAAHSSQIFTDAVGYGAIFELARILNDFRVQLSDTPLLSFNPGIIAGGTRVSDKGLSTIESFGKRNVVAQTAIVKGGLRAVSPEQLVNTQNAMQQIVAHHLAKTNATLVFDEGYPPMQQTQGNMDLLAFYSKVSVDLGYKPVSAVNPRNAGAADISFVADHVDMAIDGLGLMGTGGHTKDEVADMTTFAQNIEKTAVLLYRLSLQKN